MAENTAVARSYAALLADIKDRILRSQVRAAVAVNRELVLLYWGIGAEISRRQKQEGWGTKVIEKLSRDLKRSFPEMEGFSVRNLKYMKAFAEAWPDEEIVQQAAAQIPWFHNCILLDKVKNPDERFWYIQQTIQNGWSRTVLEMQIEGGLFRRQGKALTNFGQTLPAPQSDLAQQLLKDPYNFDFLTLANDARERELEAGLLEQIRRFLLELGVGFAFVGSQYPLQVGAEEYRIDLLFYHLKLRCFIVIDLKMTPFKPEYAGKMNFYLSAVDDLLRHATDQPTIGVILCKGKERIVVEYALRNMQTPMGVAEFRHLEEMPAEFQASLPTVQQIEAELSDSDSQLRTTE